MTKGFGDVAGGDALAIFDAMAAAVLFGAVHALMPGHGKTALVSYHLDAVVLAAFAAIKWQSDPLIVLIGIVGMALVFLFVRVFLARNPVREGDHH